MQSGEMTSLRSLFVVGLAALAALAAPIAASAADMAGTWVVKGVFGPKIKYTLLCVLNADGPALSGSCFAGQGYALATTGAFNGDKMHFGYSTDFEGNTLHLNYTGAMQPSGYVKGGVVNQMGAGGFQGALLAPVVADHPQLWSFDVAFSQDIKFTLVCGFRMTNVKLAGPCITSDGAALVTKGAVDSSTVTFAYDTQVQGRPLHVEYSGGVQPDGSIKGSITAGGGIGEFSAARK